MACLIFSLLLAGVALGGIWRFLRNEHRAKMMQELKSGLRPTRWTTSHDCDLSDPQYCEISAANAKWFVSAARTWKSERHNNKQVVSWANDVIEKGETILAKAQPLGRTKENVVYSDSSGQLYKELCQSFIALVQEFGSQQDIDEIEARL